MSFEIASPTRIIFGPGTIGEMIGETSQLGKRSLLVCGRTRDRCKWLQSAMEETGCQVTLFQADPEPTVGLVLQGVKKARESDSEFIVGMGGGSAIDTGKAISALLTNPGDPFEYLEVIGEGRPLLHPAAPFIAIPTTAGTGAEVTRNAVLGSPSHGVKVSLRSPKMFPHLALVDPELTYSLPASVTAATGMDALTQVIEAFVSRKANPFTDSLCREGIGRAARSLKRAFESGDDPTARADMSLTSLFSGLALANAGLGAVHGLAAPLGGITGAPHGDICAAMLPYVMRANIGALQRIDNSSRFLVRYKELARILTRSASAEAEDGVLWIRKLSAELQIRTLSELGLDQESFEPTVEKALRASSMRGNPVDLSREALSEILMAAS